MFSSDPGVKKVSPEKRKCLFANEEKLHLFNNYSFSNCILECYMNLASNVTGCIPWYLPRSNDTKIETCDPWKTNKFLVEISSMDQSQCGHCLSDCNTVKYTVASTSTKFKYKIFFEINLFCCFNFIFLFSRPCDATNLNLSPLCNILNENIDSEVSELMAPDFRTIKIIHLFRQLCGGQLLRHHTTPTTLQTMQTTFWGQ